MHKIIKIKNATDEKKQKLINELKYIKLIKSNADITKSRFPFKYYGKFGFVHIYGHISIQEIDNDFIVEIEGKDSITLGGILITLISIFFIKFLIILIIIYYLERGSLYRNLSEKIDNLKNIFE